MIDTTQKQWYILKTNGVNNIRSINASLGAAPEIPIFWLAGFMTPKKIRNTPVLRKQFLFYDYAFVQLNDPRGFEAFLSERKIPAYFLYRTGTKIPAALSDADVAYIKSLETLKQIEADKYKPPHIGVGACVEICNGPFIGCKGVVLEFRRSFAIIEMNVFKRPTRVPVSVDFLNSSLQNYEKEEEEVAITEDVQ